MISIENAQTEIAIDIKQLEHDAQRILDELGYTDFDLGILLATDEQIHKYNKEHRDKDKPTDVLSYPFHHIAAGERIETDDVDEKNLGDLIIAPAYVKKDAPNWDHTFEQRMRVLLVHGICHLLGYDHIEDSDYIIMKKEEDRLLAILDGITPLK